MLASLDHDDFIKSKKALITSSISVLVLDSVAIPKNAIQWAGITLNISQPALLVLAKIAFIYFFAIFLVMFYIKRKEYKLEDYSKIVEYRKVQDNKNLSENDKELAAKNRNTQNAKFVLSQVVDLVVPMVVALVCIWKMLPN